MNIAFHEPNEIRLLDRNPFNFFIYDGHVWVRCLDWRMRSGVCIGKSDKHAATQDYPVGTYKELNWEPVLPVEINSMECQYSMAVRAANEIEGSE